MRETRANTKTEREILRDKKQIVRDFNLVGGHEYYYYRVNNRPFTNVSFSKVKLVETANVTVIDADMFDPEIRLFEPKRLFTKQPLLDFKALAYGNITYCMYVDPKGTRVITIISKGKVIDKTTTKKKVDLWDFSREYQERLISNVKQIKKN